MAHTELNVRERRRIEDMLNAVCNASLCRYYKVIPMEKAMPTPVAVKLDEDIHSRVKVLAEARDRSSHWMMREAIAQYVEREEKCEAFRQDGIRAWDAYQETGLHVTHAEADAWLAQLATGEDQDPPECPA